MPNKRHDISGSDLDHFGGLKAPPNALAAFSNILQSGTVGNFPNHCQHDTVLFPNQTGSAMDDDTLEVIRTEVSREIGNLRAVDIFKVARLVQLQWPARSVDSLANDVARCVFEQGGSALWHSAVDNGFLKL